MSKGSSKVVSFVAPESGAAIAEGQLLPLWAHFPTSLRDWWIWTEEGFDAWRIDVWTVIGWLIAGGFLLITLIPALIGHTAKFARNRWGRG